MKRFAPASAALGLLLLMGSITFAAEYDSRPYAPVQDGFVPVAEDVLPFAPDRILVKFTPEALSRATIRPAVDKSARRRLGLDGAGIARRGLGQV